MTDWDALYVAGDMPWDLGAPLPLLTDAITRGLLGAPGTAFVPGGGRGHDAGALADAGWTTTVVDLSPTAVDYGAARYPGASFVLGDALDPAYVLARTGGQVDLLWDHTFFCALPPTLRPQVGLLAAALVRPGGLLASGVFPIGRSRDEQGPPWAYVPEDMDAVLDGFDRVHTGEPVHVNPHFGDHHRLAIWRRREVVSGR
jgi:methyl halide transferase